MNYRHVYMLIVEHAKSEQRLGLRPKNKQQRKNFPDKYFEFHHILPKSIYPLWVKRESNIVPLTAREHFFCHQLLIKVYPCRQTYRALAMFTKNCHGKRILSSKQYELCRKALTIANKLWWEEHKDDEDFRKRRKDGAIKMKEFYKNNPEKLENLKKLKREQSSKCHWWTNGIQETFSEKCPDGWSKGRLGFKNNQEYKQKRANIMKGRVFWNNGLISIRSIDCPGPSFVRGRLKKVNIN